MTVHGQHYWASRFAADASQLDKRRKAGLEQAAALRQTWPQIQAIHLFGSILDERLRDHAEYDLLVEGLAAAAWIDAIVLAERLGPLSVGLKRREDINDDLAERLHRRSQTL